ncbi:LOW QUALITY PROTEIN: hypothetical protein T265_12998 [Opisthorchis viverrini]|uniref:C2H2-type domain-containing protein n=1 Tax=Opisthorchis viverrini TaxID=6198 RepID=A0A074ZV47_OPIVI|nr:LOW QUALITY PROTEIN: hypothetical protein T265_12998 [Opisthorchis viverrini]KER31343.1 LOW QUALITY PROTEIN: hypothetical protein T265_12998 [Opisthorchis viverrini]
MGCRLSLRISLSYTLNAVQLEGFAGQKPETKFHLVMNGPEITEATIANWQLEYRNMLSPSLRFISMQSIYLSVFHSLINGKNSVESEGFGKQSVDLLLDSVLLLTQKLRRAKWIMVEHALHLKDRLPVDRTRNCVCKIKCNDCTKVYIGQTARELHTRIGEHKRSIKRPPRNVDYYQATVKDSTVAKHALDTEQRIDLENVYTLRRNSRFTTQLLVTEAVEIAKHLSVNRIEGKRVEIGFKSAEITRGGVQLLEKWCGSKSTKSK